MFCVVDSGKTVDGAPLAARGSGLNYHIQGYGLLSPCSFNLEQTSTTTINRLPICKSNKPLLFL